MAAPASLALGVDLGSSGIRIALATPAGERIGEWASAYPRPFRDPRGWREGLITLTRQLSSQLRQQVAAIAIDGTSGTLLLCHPNGDLPAAPLHEALPYHQSCPAQGGAAQAIAGVGPAASASGSLARALTLLEHAAASRQPGPWLLRHQADWLLGWLLGDWRWGEEGNNLRLGWDLQQGNWRGSIGAQPWSGGLPAVRSSGEVLGTLHSSAAGLLGLPMGCRVVAGSTDANAAVLAADPQDRDGVAVLGTTLVLKQWSPGPIEGPGVSSHRLAGRWLVGGASNAGAGVLRRFYNDAQLEELSRQIDPSRPSGLQLRPLPGQGERFPVDDPSLEPVLEPRPVSDVLYLQALLEGLARIEAAGWQRLQALGAPPVDRVISVGGGAVNPQWRHIRSQELGGLPVLNRPGLSAALGMARLAATALVRP
jgi:D-ribulokinase